MKPSEKEVLDTLRKSTLSYLGKNEFSIIEQEVERKGLLNLTGLAKTIIQEAVQKHGTGDQKPHGSWAGNGAGGGLGGARYIQDLSPKDQAEYIRRAKDAKSLQEVKELAREFKTKYGAGGSGTSGSDSGTIDRIRIGQKALENNNYDKMMADYDKMESSWRKKLSKPSSKEEYGDPQDMASMEFKTKYGADVLDVQDANNMKKSNLSKHGSHDQRAHGSWSDDSEGEDDSEPKNYYPPSKFTNDKDDSENPAYMDDMDILRPPKRLSSK